jgi:hypothetical protein
MRQAGPAMLELRPEGDDEQDWKTPYEIERQIKQLTRSRVNPMGVLNYHEEGPAPRQRFKLMQQGFEQHLALALRAKIELVGGARQ